MTQLQINFTPRSNRDSQKMAILDYLKAGNRITPLEALDLFKCMRLGGRIYDIKQDGFTIEKKMIKVGSGKYVAEYMLAK